jgi:hypothetical protein
LAGRADGISGNPRRPCSCSQRQRGSGLTTAPFPMPRQR